MFHKSQPKITLALQGAGSHGAFTWGVLDRLLEEEDLFEIEGVSGTSSGALNATMLVQGYATGGKAGARKALDDLWRRIGNLVTPGFSSRMPVDQIFGNWDIDRSPVTMLQNMVGHMIGTAHVSSMTANPLRNLLESCVDVELVRHCAALKLYIAATDIEKGAVRLFPRNEFSIDVLMASASLPLAFGATKANDTLFWDGGYTCNPSVFSLADNCVASDLLVVQVIPFARRGIPTTLPEIATRTDEIAFNNAWIASMRGLAREQLAVEEGRLKIVDPKLYRPMHFHVFHDASGLSALGAMSRVTLEPSFLAHLKNMGRRCADAWIARNRNRLGQASTIDLKKLAKDGVIVQD